MDRIYKGNFSEIEKLVDENKIQEHPYSDLYRYIRRTNMETLRKNCIRRTLSANSERVRYQLERHFERNCGENVDLSMQPYLIKPYAKIVKKYSNQIGQIKTLDIHANFEEMVEKIYIDVMDKINESPKLVAEEIEKLYNKIIDECNETLNGIKYRGQYLIEETQNGEELIRRINKETVQQLTSKISEKDLDSFFMLELSEIKRLKLSKECLELSDEINNSKNVVFTYLLEIVKRKIKKYEKKIFEQLRENKNKHLLKRFISENIVEFKEKEININLSLERLAELKIKGELFELLNVRCRLKLVEEYLTTNIEKEYLEDIANGKKKVKNIKDYVEVPQFETIEPRNIAVILDIIHKKYRKIKCGEYNEYTTAIANIQKNSELFKTQTIKELEEELNTNIMTITMPSAQGMISRRNALYIVKTLIVMEEKKEELNTFLNKENIAKLPNNEENYILNSTLDLLNNYVTEDETKEKQKIKTIGNRGE